jgi:heat shock protein HtpX
MQMFKRFGLFIGINILVVLTLSTIVSVLGLQPRISATGYDMTSLIIFCLIWGMGGAFISLLLSKKIAKWTMGVQVIDPQTTNPSEREVLDAVYRFARTSGLSTMPEVGVYPSPEVNAFATGPTKSNSLVAVSSGLLQTMNKSSVEGVLAHEVAHIANGDMVTMTLLQGVMNAFVMALARIVAFGISNALRGDDRDGKGLGPFAYWITVMLLETVFMLLGSIVIMWFSRQREFRADAGGAKFAGRGSMISALQSLRMLQERNFEVAAEAEPTPAFASLKISASKPGWANILRTHPTLEDRIARLERGA